MKNLIALGLLVAVGAQAQTATVVDVSHSPEQRVVALEQRIQQQSRIQLEMQQYIDTLQQEVNELRGLTETHSYRLNQMLQRQRELYQEIDKRFTILQTQGVQPTAQASIPVTGDSSQVLSMTQLYDSALSLALKDKKFDQAIIQFQRYLTEFPKTTYTANAHYWLGQLLFNQGKLTQAQQQFSDLVNNYPDSSKAADAMVKLGKIAQDNKQLAKAKSFYLKVIKQYPSKSAAQIARTRLNSLK
ncbi:MAG: tol-pal system protein YbgF [Gammaproteobacteria bacterium]|nr:tol-pal system protein YbgF [Gammaproteobacteria bacterium]